MEPQRAVECSELRLAEGSPTVRCFLRCREPQTEFSLLVDDSAVVASLESAVMSKYGRALLAGVLIRDEFVLKEDRSGVVDVLLEERDRKVGVVRQARLHQSFMLA